ncbi:MerR family transcriptional regulator [Nocardioides sp. NPDC127503]|uniref:MerR family transcriptional regulator n=1 Tax=Nocardioides sp. NPDC127503 TaxID=3154516 RepID=UPI003330E700
MFSIGDFARHGQVSVRMLRHYDKIGLLRPARVDPVTGYRSYDAGQLGTLNRIVALKDLGLTLQQVGWILADDIGAEDLRGMLHARRVELAAQIDADIARLAQVESRLRIIEAEGAMPTAEVVVRSVAPARVAEVSASAAGFDPESITPVIRPLYERLSAHLADAAVSVVAPAIAYYDHHADGTVTVHAALPIGGNPAGRDHFVVKDLPAVTSAATLVHRGPMEDVMSSVQQLARWVDSHGFSSAGPSREVYLDVSADGREFVTELQEPIAAT